jgi:RNA 2',3'-cyclic 3'-phosphodiesterase
MNAGPAEGQERGAALRLFVAIAVPQTVKAAIEQTQAELRRLLPHPAVRWTRPDQFHLTLKFLGAVEADRVVALQEALRGACAAFPALQLRAVRFSCFPNPRSPRVLWVGVEDAEAQLPLVHSAVETAVAGFTSQTAEGRFTGHVTLARIRDLPRADAAMLERWLTEMAERNLGNWTADRVELIRSELQSGGARYATLATVPLAGAAS